MRAGLLASSRHIGGEPELRGALRGIADHDNIALPQGLPANTAIVDKGAVHRLAIHQDNCIICADNDRVPSGDHVRDIGAVKNEITRLRIPANYKVPRPWHMNDITILSQQVNHASAWMAGHPQAFLSTS